MAVESSPSFPVALFPEGATHSLEGRSTELLSGGVFVASEGPLPKLFSRVRMRLSLPDGEIECDGEVVRIVEPGHTATWRLPVGCAVQFLGVSAALKAAVRRAAAVRSAEGPPADPELHRVITASADADHYALLGLKRDAESSVASGRADAYKTRLEQTAASATEASASELRLAIERVTRAGAVLGDPAHRADYDAEHSNFRGVARCIAGGLTVSRLEICRARFLSTRPMAAINAMARVTSARLLESVGRHEEALVQFEQALRLDPLNLKLHLAWSRASRLLKPISGRTPIPT